ncbi:MAG: hypothetical protein ACKO34_01640 [Vampirovibrionales bacterium]
MIVPVSITSIQGGFVFASFWNTLPQQSFVCMTRGSARKSSGVLPFVGYFGVLGHHAFINS